MAYAKVIDEDGNLPTMCTACGSHVLDQRAHDEWHEGIASAVAAAHRAAALTRPIGNGIQGRIDVL